MLSDYIKTFPQYILPKKWLTTYAGYLADVKTPAIKNKLIQTFIRRFQVDMTEALEENPTHYASFNDFFIRALKPSARPIAQADIVSPADGFISQIGTIDSSNLLQAKGRYYSAQELLACDQKIAQQFDKGWFATVYLSPKDYHRVHMPVAGKVKHMIYVPGKLFSVQPATARLIPKLFARNERLVVLFETHIGLMAMVLVGATIVGGIGTHWQGDIPRGNKLVQFNYPTVSIQAPELAQGDEMGYFKLGSTVVLLFSNDANIQWSANLHAGQPIRMGEAIGHIAS